MHYVDNFKSLPKFKFSIFISKFIFKSKFIYRRISIVNSLLKYYIINNANIKNNEIATKAEPDLGGAADDLGVA